ncbi:MAG: CocE/NonD family hydrolase [Streptosporangiaceae bacterium]
MTEPSPGRGAVLPRHVRLMMRLSRRDLRDLPPPECAVRVDAGLAVPAADGAVLRTDHYIPQVGSPRPTVLVRTPYGRGFPWDHLFGGLLAEQGYHVVIQSCRGTAGSGGEFQPFRHEGADGLATVAWLREQDWFTGVLATIGPSYLSYVQWALATDPPPELRAIVSQNGVSDPYAFAWPGGAFALENVLVATAAMLSFERGMVALIRSGLRAQRRLRRVARRLPLIDAYPAALGTRVAHLDEWLQNPGRTDPYWASLEIGADRPVPPVPASMLTGWWDACLDEVLARYGQLRANGTPARLVVGPWTHASGFSRGLPVIMAEALSWLRAYTGDTQTPGPVPNENLPVRVHVGGAGEWRDLADWPPPELDRQSWYLGAGGSLAAEPPELQDHVQPGVSPFRYDPADPTPSAGGQLLTGQAGAVDNRALEARRDVLVFSSAPLTGTLDVIGPVSVRVRVRASSPHFDLFARLCDVDPRGRSRNVCDGIIRHQPGADGGEETAVITVAMSATAYQFRAGHRLRLQVSGGAHPRFARNTGSGEPPASATRLAAVDVQIVHEVTDPAALSLPVLPRRSDPGGQNGTLGHQHTSRSPDVNPRAAARSRTQP